jgi:hypothetical protein
MSTPIVPPSPPPPVPSILAARTVRYPLLEMLNELDQDRTTGSFAMEKLNQAEITKLVENKKASRARKN